MTAIRVYRPAPASGFSWVHPVDNTAAEQLDRISGERLTDWSPPLVKFLPSNDRHPETDRVPDVPWQGQHSLVFRERAFDLVRPIMEKWGQFLELRTEESNESLWIFNVCTVVDALDEGASNVLMYPDNVRIMSIPRWVFKPEALAPPVVFRIPKQRTLLLSGDVVARIRDLGLSGAEFKLLWSSD